MYGNASIAMAIIMVAWCGAAVDEPRAPLAPVKLYHGVNRPVMIEVAEPGDARELALVLMDAFGKVLVEPAPVAPGQIDLAERMPDIWRIRSACYLQLVRDGEPYGSALVLQPMLSRPPIWVRKDTRPDGRRYSRVIGWGEKPPPGWGDEPAGAGDDGAGETGEQPPPSEEKETGDDDSAPEIEPQVFSGLRIYPERDVILRTSKGEIRLAMTPEEAPNTVWNFLELVRGGYYTNIIFHRIVPLERNGWPFVIQAGDPSETGSGGPGYWLPLEPSALPHDFGVISMARADDPDSAGGQFFICLSREGTARLDGQYCAFGYAVEGARAILDIANVKLADVATGKPEVPPLIYEGKVVPAPPRVPGKGRPDGRVTREDAEKPARKPERVDR